MEKKSPKPKLTYEDRLRSRHVRWQDLPLPRKTTNFNRQSIRMAADLLKDFRVTEQEVADVFKAWTNAIEDVIRVSDGCKISIPFIGTMEPMKIKYGGDYLRSAPQWMKISVMSIRLTPTQWLEAITDPEKSKEMLIYMTKKRSLIRLQDIVTAARDGITGVQQIDLVSRTKQAMDTRGAGIQSFIDEGQGIEGGLPWGQEIEGDC